MVCFASVLVCSISFVCPGSCASDVVFLSVCTVLFYCSVLSVAVFLVCLFILVVSSELFV